MSQAFILGSVFLKSRAARLKVLVWVLVGLVFFPRPGLAARDLADDADLAEIEREIAELETLVQDQEGQIRRLRERVLELETNLEFGVVRGESCEASCSPEGGACTDLDLSQIQANSGSATNLASASSVTECGRLYLAHPRLTGISTSCRNAIRSCSEVRDRQALDLARDSLASAETSIRRSRSNLAKARRERSIARRNCVDCRELSQRSARRGAFARTLGGGGFFISLGVSGGGGMGMGGGGFFHPYVPTVGQMYHPAYAGWGMPGLLPDVTGFLGMNSFSMNSMNGGMVSPLFITHGMMAHPGLMMHQQYWLQLQQAQYFHQIQQAHYFQLIQYNQQMQFMQGVMMNPMFIQGMMLNGGFGFQHPQQMMQQQWLFQQQMQQQWLFQQQMQQQWLFQQQMQQQMVRQQDAIVAYQQMLEAARRYQMVTVGGLTAGGMMQGGRLF